MKKVNLLIILLISLFVTTEVKAITYTDEDIEDYSIVIGSHIFTTEPEESTGYDGFLTTKFAMLGASSITEYDSADDMIIYYKWGVGDWEEYITGELVDFPESVNITHVNGVCVDPSCDGTVIEVTLKYNNATAYTDETPSSSTMNTYLSKYTEPATPTKLGFDFVCWTLDDECYDFNTELEKNITLEAEWEPRTYNVTYHDTVGGGEQTITCDFASATPCAYIPYDSDLLFELPAGYTFVGWSLAETGEKVYSNDDIVEIYGENTDIDLFSIFSSGVYKVSYNLGGGTFSAVVSPVTEYEPSNLTYNLYEPTRIGYTFKGWTVDSSSAGKATINTNKTFTITTIDDIVLKANWEANEYNVVYNNLGANVQLNTATCVYDSNCALDLTKITVPSGKRIKDIYVTVGSNTYAIGDTVKNLTTSSEDLIATVVFEDITYSITYDYAGGSVSTANDTEMVLGDSATLNVPTKTGYTFAGWTVSSGLTLSGGRITLKTAGNATVTANWNANSYNVYYKNGNTDVLLSTSSCKYDSFCDLDLSKITASAGYEFDHIEGTINGSTVTLGNRVINLTSSANGRYYVTPEFNKVQYNVTYNLNGGTLTNPNGSVTTYGDTLIINVPTKVGYDFAGWNVTSGRATVTNTSVTLTGAAAVTLSAQWTPKEYDIAFDLDDGTGSISSVSCTYESCTLPTTIPTKEGYDFDGWLYNGNVYAAGDDAKLDVSGNITFSAKWVNTNVYDINYDLDGGTFDGSPVSSFIAGDSFALTTPLKEGYTFDGWYNGKTKITTVVDHEADINVIAKWIPITYKVYLHDGSTSESILKEIDCTYDVVCSLEDNSSSFANQRLLGWSKSSGGNTFYGDNLQLMNLVSVAGDDIHLYPVLEKVSSDYIVSYYLDGGTFVDESNVVREANNSDTITLPGVEKFGYEVEKWVTDSGVEVTGTTYTVTDDVVLVPVWKQRTSYTVNLIHGADDTVEPIVVNCEIGVECKLPANTFTRNGYAFDGWLLQLTGEGGNAIYEDQDIFGMSFDVAIDQNTFEFDVYAIWTPITYNISYELQGAGYFNGTTTYTVEDEYIKIPLDGTDNFTNGYTSSFVAWSDEAGNIIDVCTDDANYVCAPVPETLGDLTFIAHYADEKFTVSWSYTYEYKGMMGGDRTAEDNGTIELTYGDLITGLPEEISYGTFGTDTAKISYWSINGNAVDLSTYRVTSDVTLTAVFE